LKWHKPPFLLTQFCISGIPFANHLLLKTFTPVKSTFPETGVMNYQLMGEIPP